jgi:diaminopimelate epimerase
MMHFWKMNGAGNDFVVVDNREQTLNLSDDQIARLCNRQRGIGADGFLAVEPAQNGADFRMRYYNADGGEAEMCGNGARCFARFVNRLHDESLEKVSFETIAGVIHADFQSDLVRINLSKPFDQAMGAELQVLGQPMTVHSINTGVPHAVIVVENLEAVAIRDLGAAIRFHEHFAPAGTNVNFLQAKDDGSIAIRTYERGVEDETLACGTGMVACAIVHSELGGAETPIRVSVRGGDQLEVNFQKVAAGDFENVTLFGPADFTFEGNATV